MHFKKEGDFRLSYEGRPIIREVRYLSNNALITCLKLHAYKDGSFGILVDTKDQAAQAQFVEATSSAGFESPLFEARNYLSTKHHHPALLKKFVESLTKVEPKIEEIQSELFDSLGINADYSKITYNHSDMVSILNNREATLDEISHFNPAIDVKWILNYAFSYLRINSVTLILQQYPQLKNEFLHYALQNNKHHLAEFLHQKGAELNDDEAKAFFFQALTEKNFKKMKTVIRCGSDKLINSSEIIEAAIKCDRSTLFTALIERGVPLTSIFEDPDEGLLKAIKNGDSKLVSILLELGVDPSQHDSNTLRSAVCSENPSQDIVEMLIAKGAMACSYSYRLPLLALYQYDFYDDIKYLECAKLLLKQISNQNAQSIIDKIDKLIQGKVKYNIVLDEIIIFIKTLLTPTEVIAFEMLLRSDELKSRNAESAMEGALERIADKKFNEEFEPALKARFKSYAGKTETDKINTIEKEIKAVILESIQENCRLNPSNENNFLSNFITKNKILLLNEDPKACANMRTLAVSNEDVAQIAWRAYDKDAPCDTAWVNLLATYEVSVESLLVRKRVAYYFIAEPPIDRLNFLEQLAGIRRAHNDTGNVDNLLDSPSCLPGAKGRIAEMGAGHPLLQLPPSRHAIIQRQISALVMRTFTIEMQTKCEAEQEALFNALITLTTNTAEDILNKTVDFDEEWLTLRQAFYNKMGTQRDILEQINVALMDEKLEPFSRSDQLYFDFEYQDISGSGRAMALSERYQQITEVHLDIRKALPIQNPFKIGPDAIPNQLVPAMQRIMARRIENEMRKFVEFELLFPVCSALFNTIKDTELKDIVVSFINDIYDTEINERQSKIYTLCEEFVNKNQARLSILHEDKTKIIETLVCNSSFSNLSEMQIDSVKKHLHDKWVSLEKQHYNEYTQKAIHNILAEFHTRKSVLRTTSTLLAF